jgi:hypothetical protein
MKFSLRGALDPRSDEVSQADTVANSSVYKVLVDDMDGFERFMKRTKAE